MRAQRAEGAEDEKVFTDCDSGECARFRSMGGSAPVSRWGDKLITMIWYPASVHATETQQWVGDPAHPFANAGRAARDAELAATPKRFPLILLSHGTGGSALMMA